MKKCVLGMAVAAAGLVLLTSCLGSSNNEFTTTSPGVVTLDSKTARMIVQTRVGGIYAKGFETYNEGDCVVVNFTVNQDSPENAEASKTGYYFSTLNVAPVEVSQYAINQHQADTSKLLVGEKPIIQAMTPNLVNTYLSYIEKRLFLPVAYNGISDESLAWDLSYDRQNMKAEEENGKRVYSLFLRRRVVKEGTKKAEDKAELLAFRIGNFIDQVNSLEKAASSKEFYVKINYIDKINEKDSTYTWAKMDPNFYITFAVPADK
ncbi:MAG: hypothetical protein RRZ65_05145 [Tannerellaceae bacterium]